MTPGKTPEERAEWRRTHWKARKIHLHDDQDEFDREAIADMSPEERMALSWELTKTTFLMRGIDGASVRLDRSVARVERRGG